MAVAWRITCLILLMVASFQLATIVQAQPDYSFSHWLEVRQRLAAEQGIKDLGRHRFSFMTTAQQRQEDFEQYEKDKAEAAERGISVEAVLAERLTEEARAIKLFEAEFEKTMAKGRAEDEKREAIQLAVAATIAIAVIVFVARRWRRKSKAFRVWVFGSFFWAVGTLLYIWLVEPYGSRMNDDEVWHMFSVMIVPPLFLGAVWFGYKRFVDLQVKAAPQRVITDEDDTEDRED